MARIVLPGHAHHVTHRGNRGAAVFFDDRDRQSYLGLLAHYSRRYELEIWAYCLMTNHVHLLVVPSTPSAMADGIGRTHMMHARRVNAHRSWTGHLWANRFYSAPVQAEAVALVAKYIELNPARARMTDTPESYPWSSAKTHCLGACDPLLSPSRPFAGGGQAWATWLRDGLETATCHLIRGRTATGTPFGDAEYLEAVERTVGRRLTRRTYSRGKGKNRD